MPKQAPAKKAAPKPSVTPPPPEPKVEAVEAVENVADSAEKPEPTAAAPSTLTLDQVKGVWPQMRKLVQKSDRNIPSLLDMSAALAVEGGNTIVLGFNYAVLKDRFDSNADALPLVAEAFSTALGSKCQVRSVETNKYAPAHEVSREDVEQLADELGGVVRDNE